MAETEPKFNSSFIPKKMLQENVDGAPSSNQFVKHHRVMGPGYFLSLLLFVVAVLASGFLFAWTRVVDQRVEEKIATLEAKRQAYDDAVVQDLLRVDTRLSEARRLLNAHVALSELFDLLETDTLTMVRYNRMNYRNSHEGDGPIELELTGTAQTFKDVALQMDTFRTNEFLQSPYVTQLARQVEENVGFTMLATVNPRLITYANAIEEDRRSTPTARPTPVVSPALESTADPAEEETL